jgi:hypothetical protein
MSLDIEVTETRDEGIERLRALVDEVDSLAESIGGSLRFDIVTMHCQDIHELINEMGLDDEDDEQR